MSKEFKVVDDVAEALFPEEWGAGCPPAEAVNPGGTYYRRVTHSPPIADDFFSFSELGRKVSALRACEGHGLSVFTSIEDAWDYADRYPDSGRVIAKADLNHTDGKVKPSPRSGDSHTTWWPFSGISRHKKFVVVP